MDPAELARENEALNEQVKLLVKTERRLYSAQRLIEQQLGRQEALAALAGSAARTGDPDVMLALALQTMIDMLNADQALALAVTPSFGARLAAMVTQPGCEPADRTWRAAAFELPLLTQPMLLTQRQPSMSGRIAGLLEVVDDYFAPARGEARSRQGASVELVVPLRRKSGRPLAVIVVRKLAVKTSYHEPHLSEADLPFVELVASRIEAFVENVLLYRDLEAFAADLEAKVARRTADLARSNDALTLSLRRVRETQAQLVEAEKSAAMLTLVAGLSHELNNPIGVILGYAQGLLSATGEPVTRKQLAAIERQARRCSVLVRAMLGFSAERPQAIDSIPPALLLQQVVADAKADADERGVSLFVDVIADDLPQLAISEESVRDALGQLVKNALDATTAGGTVLLHARQRQRNGTWGVELSVRDSGAGIPRAFLSRIFDPFFTTKAPGRGVGLGLSLARRAIETHGGRIDVRSQVLHGTTVRVWLPVTGGERDAGSSARHGAAGAR
jgi:signal transduction histidine kinase